MYFTSSRLHFSISLHLQTRTSNHQLVILSNRVRLWPLQALRSPKSVLRGVRSRSKALRSSSIERCGCRTTSRWTICHRHSASFYSIPSKSMRTSCPTLWLQKAESSSRCINAVSGKTVDQAKMRRSKRLCQETPTMQDYLVVPKQR